MFTQSQLDYDSIVDPKKLIKHTDYSIGGYGEDEVSSSSSMSHINQFLKNNKESEVIDVSVNMGMNQSLYSGVQHGFPHED